MIDNNFEEAQVIVEGLNFMGFIKRMLVAFFKNIIQYWEFYKVGICIENCEESESGIFFLLGLYRPKQRYLEFIEQHPLKFGVRSSS